MRALFLILCLMVSACAAGSVDPKVETKPTATSRPTVESGPVYKAFLEGLQERIQRDESIPQVGREAVIVLAGKEPTFVFPDNRGNVVQFLVQLPESELEVKQVGVLLMGSTVIAVKEWNVPLEGIEVVFFTEGQEPWLALALRPPWSVGKDMRLKPLHPEYIRRLLEAGVITPTPEPAY